MTAPNDDLYEVLGVTASAPAAVIAAAYRALAKTAHPDAGGDNEAFQRIEHAYHVLSDSRRRSEYDRSRRANSSQAQAAANHHPGPAAHTRGTYRGANGTGTTTNSGTDPNANGFRAAAAREAAAREAANASSQGEGFRWVTPDTIPSPVVVHPPITWAVFWRFGILGLVFCSFVGDVLTKLPRPAGFAAGSFDGATTGFAMLILAVGAAAITVRFRPQTFRGLPVLPWIYGAAGLLSLVAIEANQPFSSTAVLIGAVGVFIGTRDVETRRVLLGAARPSAPRSSKSRRPSRARQRINDLDRRVSSSPPTQTR